VAIGTSTKVGFFLYADDLKLENGGSPLNFKFKASREQFSGFEQGT
jgi:hypothetical protein